MPVGIGTGMIYVHGAHSHSLSLSPDYSDVTMPGKEVIVMYNMSSLNQNPDEYFTDANGRQMMRRMRFQRSYDVSELELRIQPESSNYYPITTGGLG